MPRNPLSEESTEMTASSQESSASPILKLVLDQNTDKVLVVPADEDRFVIKVERLVDACRREQDRDTFEVQFKILLDQLAKWLKSRHEIRSAFLTLRDGGLAFVVVTKDSTYNEVFDDALSAIDLQIAGDVDLDLISMNTISLPNVSQQSLTSFLDRTVVLEFPNGE